MKKKLTLSIDENVVKKAKNLGLNISELTEKILRTYTHDASSIDIIAKYKEVFETMLPLLRRFNISIKIGEIHLAENLDEGWVYSEHIYLNGKGEIICPALMNLKKSSRHLITNIQELSQDSIEKYGIEFDDASRILNEFIDKISEAIEKRRQKVKELEIVKKIINVIMDSLWEEK